MQAVDTISYIPGVAFSAEETQNIKIVVEYFPLPITSLQVRALYRVVSPIETVWAEYAALPLLEDAADKPFELVERIKREVFTSWAEAYAKVGWKVGSVEMHEVEFVRKK